MTNRERAMNILHFKPVDRMPAVHFGYWRELLDEWAEQGKISMDLAKAVGEELGMEPVRTLRKIRNNPPQAGITGQAQRKANVLGVYRVVDPKLVQGKRVLMLDDIITTGSTAGEAARVLLTAGAAEVHCGTIAAARKK